MESCTIILSQGNVQNNNYSVNAHEPSIMLVILQPCSLHINGKVSIDVCLYSLVNIYRRPLPLKTYRNIRRRAICLRILFPCSCGFVVWNKTLDPTLGTYMYTINTQISQWYVYFFKYFCGHTTITGDIMCFLVKIQ